MPAGPHLTRSMDRLKADLREHGFGTFEGALDPKTTARIRKRVLEQGAAERRIDYDTTNIAVEPDDDVNQWVALLPNKGKVQGIAHARPGRRIGRPAPARRGPGSSSGLHVITAGDVNTLAAA